MPQVFDLCQDPQERYDIFMNNFTETTWMGVLMDRRTREGDEDLRQVSAAQATKHRLYRPHQISDYQRFEWVRQQLATEGVTLNLPTGN